MRGSRKFLPSPSVGLPPNNVEAEEAVIASLVIEPDGNVAMVSEFLRASDFYRDVNRWCYQAILYLYDHGMKIDQISVCQELQRMNKLVEIGGSSTLSILISRLPGSMYCVHWAHIVHDCAIRRRLLEIAADISRIAWEGKGAVEQLVQECADILASVFEEMGGLPCVITEFTKTDSEPPRYSMLVNGQRVEMSIDDLVEYKRFRKVVVAKCNFVPGKLKADQWDVKLNRLLSAMKEEVAPREASKSHHLWQAALRILRSQPFCETREEFESGLPARRGKHIYVKGEPFIRQWEKAIRGFGPMPDVSLLWEIVKKNGGKQGKLRFGTYRASGWQFPATILDESESGHEDENEDENQDEGEDIDLPF